MLFVSMAFRNDNPRLRVLGSLVGAVLLILLAGMARVQVLHAGLWADREQSQSLRRVRLPSVRGEITDRNGTILANNRPSYDVVIYLDQLAQRARLSKKRDILPIVQERLQQLSILMGMPVTLTDRDVRIHYAQRRALPLTVWRDLSPEQVAFFSERAAHLTGADLMVTPVRQFPNRSLAAHLLGFVGRATGLPAGEDEEDDGVFLYDQPDTVGRQGIERAYDHYLRGAPGARTIRVSPSGTTVEEVGVRQATRGNRVMLNLDARLQQATEQALTTAALGGGHYHRGAAVVLDPRNGEVLAMASVPSYDPNIFNPGVPAEVVERVLKDKLNSPMLNRALNGRYPPGSTFKPISLVAALELGVASLQSDAPVTCEGSIRIGSWTRPFRCWKHDGHGSVDMMHAMRQSCDVWFYERGMQTGVAKLAAVAGEFGLGQRTGIDLGGESAGLVPTEEWKKTELGEGWWDGNTAQLAIGQSYLVTTPLQMACVAATFANGGTRWQPHLVREIQSPDGQASQRVQPRALGQAKVARANLETVRRSMRAAVMDANGTGHLAATVHGMDIAGKTGTAEFDLFENDQRRRINRVWFIGFAPYDNPTVALAVILEDGDSGGHTAAPVAGKILAAYFGTQPARVTGGGGD